MKIVFEDVPNKINTGWKFVWWLFKIFIKKGKTKITYYEM